MPTHNNPTPLHRRAALLVVLRHMQQRPGADKHRAVVIGQSFGGTTAITLAAMNPTGLKATVNFEGGGGASARSVAAHRANLFATTRRVASQ